MNRGDSRIEHASMSALPISAHGKRRRMTRIFRRGTGKLVIAPVDDSLLAGPFAGLESVSGKLEQFIGQTELSNISAEWDMIPDAVVGYRLASQHLANRAPLAPFILNLSASTTMGIHVEKSIVGTVQDAVTCDAAAVAVHVNFTSRFEARQLTQLGEVSSAAASAGMPLMGILYPRRERDGVDDNYDALRNENPEAWTRLVSHVVRIGAEMGCSIIKTQFTGSARSFESVVQAGEGAAIVIAGGRPRGPEDFVQTVCDALNAGAAGVSFGRNFFSRTDSRVWIEAANRLVHRADNPMEVLRWLSSKSTGK